MKRYAVLFLLVMAIGEASSQNMVNIPGRRLTSLNGKWQVLIDPYETGFYTYRFTENPNGFFKAATPIGNDDFVEYSFERAEQLNVPGDWNSQKPELLYYEGTVWYHKAFVHEKSPGKKYFLHFGAVNYKAHVYVNGHKVGEHEGGFTPFSFEVTSVLVKGKNFVVVKVDNKRASDNVPTLNTDWWNYGGITRDVNLVETPQTYIEDFVLQLKGESPDQLSGLVRLAGNKKQQTLVVHIPAARVSQKFTTDSSGVARIEFRAKLNRWTPEAPILYTVEVMSETDTLREEIGFRNIAVRGQDILLNGKSVFLRGVCIHEEIPQRKGRAYSEADAKFLLTTAKELGCNYVRLAHYPHSEHMTRVADKLGLMVWAEIPVYWTIQFDNPTVLKKAKQQLAEMITRDRNRASVVLWSVANETPISESRNAFLKNLIDETRRLDNTRLVTTALEVKGWNGDKISIDDPVGAYVDVLGCNEYAGWYSPWREGLDRVPWESPFHKPLIISEFGGEALYGNHGDKDVASSWSEEHQEQLYKRQVQMLSRIPFLRGTSPWILFDFRSPKRLLPDLQDGWNRKGLLSEQGQKKKAFFVMQDFYTRLQAQWK